MAQIDNFRELHAVVADDMRLEQFIKGIEADCKKKQVDADRIDVLTVLLREIERIAHELTERGPELLFSVATDCLESHGEAGAATETREDITHILIQHRRSLLPSSP